MPLLRLVVLTSLVMLAFAGNSILCRIALKDTQIDPASFTTIRVASGALALGLLTRKRGTSAAARGNWPSALALLVYAAGFSFAYVSLPALTGALLLFAAVQVTMIGYGVAKGERLRAWQIVGLAAALGGLVGLLAPGLAAPPLVGSILMLCAGVAWGVYSLRGRGAGPRPSDRRQFFTRPADGGHLERADARPCVGRSRRIGVFDRLGRVDLGHWLHDLVLRAARARKPQAPRSCSSACRRSRPWAAYSCWANH